MPALFEGASKNWRFVLSFILFSAVFWLAEFAYQYYYASRGDLHYSVIRGFGFSGATFIALALLSSTLFRFRPALARYWPARRALGVTGTAFLVVHVVSAISYKYNGDVLAPLSPLDPFINPVVFGAVAFPVFLAVALVSTDWAVAKLGAKWKTIQRLVYPAFILAILHFLTINPPAIMNTAGYLLILLTFLALAGQLFWFYRTVKSKPYSLGTILGLILIVAAAVLGYYALFGK